MEDKTVDDDKKKKKGLIPWLLKIEFKGGEVK